MEHLIDFPLDTIHQGKIIIRQNICLYIYLGIYLRQVPEDGIDFN